MNPARHLVMLLAGMLYSIILHAVRVTDMGWGWLVLPSLGLFLLWRLLWPDRDGSMWEP